MSERKRGPGEQYQPHLGHSVLAVALNVLGYKTRYCDTKHFRRIFNHMWLPFWPTDQIWHLGYSPLQHTQPVILLHQQCRHRLSAFFQSLHPLPLILQENIPVVTWVVQIRTTIGQQLSVDCWWCNLKDQVNLGWVRWLPIYQVWEIQRTKNRLNWSIRYVHLSTIYDLFEIQKMKEKKSNYPYRVPVPGF